MKSVLETPGGEKDEEENRRIGRSLWNNRRVVKFRCDSSTSTQTNVMLARGWIRVTDPKDHSWDLWWCERSEVPRALDGKLDIRQKIPHYRNHRELTRKDNLWRNLKRYRKLLKKSKKSEESELANAMPITFELPTEYGIFLEEYHKRSGATWIVKPAAGSQGRGIFLFRRLKDLVELRTREFTCKSENQERDFNTPESFVVQEYLEDPYLIAGRKFDLRIYVLVTSFRPLRVWLAREGFARLSGVLFSLDRIDDTRVHLTNMSIQLREGEGRNVDDFGRTTSTTRSQSSTNVGFHFDQPSVTKRGRKWSLIKLREFLSARHGSTKVENLFQRVSGVVMASLQAVQTVMMHSSNSFELYGYDIIIDANLKPWLLEINASPALTPTDDVDQRLKYDMLDDVLNVLDLEGILTGREIRIGGFDLLWDGGPVWTTCPNRLSCRRECTNGVPQMLRKLNIFLGTRNDRETQLRKLHEDIVAKRKLNQQG